MSNKNTDEELRLRLQSLLIKRPAYRGLTEMLCAGLSRKQIAEQLGLSVHTVDWHLKRLYRDLGVSGAVNIARLLGQLNSNPPSEHLKRGPPHLGAVPNRT